MPHVPKLEDMASTVLAPVLTPAAAALRRDDDRELVRLAQRDDKEAFEILVKRHQGRVFAVASGILRNKEDVEDIGQQVFVKRGAGPAIQGVRGCAFARGRRQRPDGIPATLESPAEIR